MSFTVIDTETCGLCGPIVLIQYSDGFGPVHLYSPWKEKIGTTLDLIQSIVENKDGVLGFNLAFDWFQLAKLWTVFKLCPEDWIPQDHIQEIALLEPEAMDGPCLKPQTALDLMLYARKGPYQNLMARDPIIIKRVPKVLAGTLASELEKRIEIPNLFFAKRKDKSRPKWEIKEKDGDWCDVILNFAPSSALKALATHELNLDPNNTLIFSDVEISKKLYPVENRFAPFALSVGSPKNWRGAWPDVILYHINHWAYDDLARQYAEKDIIYPRELWKKWEEPAFGDDDSILACLAGAAQWKGYAVNLKGVEYLRNLARRKRAAAPIVRSNVLRWLEEVLSPEEHLALIDKDTNKPSTKKVILMEIAKLRKCDLCLSNTEHEICELSRHPAAERASATLAARKAKKEEELYDKLRVAQRFNASVNVIGTKSGRASGGQTSEEKKSKKSGSINPQGIQKQKKVRAQFQLAFTKGMVRALNLQNRFSKWEELGYPIHDETLSGGDFDAFEVSIADGYYHDPQLHQDLTAPEIGKDNKPTGVIQKIHAVIGTLTYPHHKCGNNPNCTKPCTNYWDIKETDGQDPDLYTRAKSALFALIYFGVPYTLASRLAIDLTAAEDAYAKIMARYPIMAKKRQEFYERFCPMRQPGGVGSEVTWTEPENEVRSMLGFPRFFNLENKVIKAIFELAQRPPTEWRHIRVRVQRRDRIQTASGAVQSALYAAAFQVQGANMRAAGNHVIQSTGAGLTKELQRRIWNIQPIGIHPWLVRPMNVHDELPTPCAYSVKDEVGNIVKTFIEEKKTLIPLLGMKWKKKMSSWAGK